MVPSDEHGRIITTELERLVVEQRAKGHIPFFVNATAGTTVLGAFDDINACADICEKYKMWLHVDVSHQFAFFGSWFYANAFFRLPGVEVCCCLKNTDIQDYPGSKGKWEFS